MIAMNLEIDLRDLSREQLIKLTQILAQPPATDDGARCREAARRYLCALAEEADDVDYLVATETMLKQLERSL